MRETDDIKLAAEILHQGGIIACPTETLPGLGCLPNNPHAIIRLLSIKQRVPEKGFILIAGNIEQLLPYLAPLTTAQIEKLGAHTETPTTWLAPAASDIEPLLRGQHKRLAIRISSHPTVQKLCAHLGQPLISTSANLAGNPAALRLHDISSTILQQIDLLLTGPEGTGRASCIRDLETDAIIRE